MPLGGLFGGKKEKPAVSTTQTDALPRYQEYFNELAKGAQSEFQRASSSPGPNFAGAVAGFDPSQVSGQNRLLGLSAGPLEQFMQTMLGTAGTNLTDFLRPDNPTVQNAVQAALDPVVRTFQQSVLPGLRGEAVLTGNVGSSRQGVAEGLATDALTQNLLNTSAGITNQAFQTGLDQMIRTLALSPQLASASTLPGLIETGVGEQRQQQAQRELEGELAGEVFQEQRGATALSNYANILASLPGGVSTGTQVAARGGSGGAGSAIGLGLQGYKLGTSLFPGLAAAGPVGAGLGILASLF